MHHNNVAECLQKVKFAPRYLKLNFFVHMGFLVVLAALAAFSFIQLKSYYMGAVFLAAEILWLFKVIMIPSNLYDGLNEREFDNLREVAVLSPKVAKYIKAKKDRGEKLTGRDYHYLNIEKQIGIIRSEICFERLKNIINLPSLDAGSELGQQLRHIQIKPFKTKHAKKATWKLSRNVTVGVALIWVSTILFFSFSPYQLNTGYDAIVLFANLFILLTLSLNTIWLFAAKNFLSDAVLSLTYYDQLEVLAKYKHENMQYLEKVVGENRLLTQDDLYRLKYNLQVSELCSYHTYTLV